MAAINSVQSSLHPHSLSGLSPPRVLMCSASVGSEGSVTLQLRDSTHSTDSTQSAASATLDNALTIGYPDPEMLADVLGNLQTACNSLKTSNNSTSSIGHNSNSNVNTCNSITVSKKLIVQETTQQPAETVTTSTSTTNRSNSKSCNTSSCLISRSSSTNLQLANVQAMNCSSAASLLSNSNNNPNSNSSSNCNSNSNSSSSSGISNYSSNNSNDSLHIAHKNSTSNSSISTGTSTSTSNNHKNVPGPNPPNILKKSRPKLSSPTRHGPQQCQVCSKVFGNASALAKHKLTHSDERKYVCAMCSKAFKRQDHLNGHMMTHRNKKPYECKADGCGKSYCDARSLRRHTENHHAAAAAASAAVAVAATPQNQTLSATTGTSLGLSLSPATASGDASSPDGATCIRTYITAAGSVVDAQTGVPLSDEQLKSITFNGGVTVLSPASSNSSCVSAASPISITEANLESEGLTRQQLDLISQIMQQTKQSSAQVTVSTSTNMNSYKIDAATTTSTATAQSTTVQQLQSANSVNRPRTWNMQTQLNSSQKVSITVDNITTATASMAAVDDRDCSLNQQLVAGINPQLLNIVKVDQKPVECNLCHRKFKNIPALNGHMRLHGGYFKKDPEAKKNEKKDTSGPPLQTASIGVRALIEEKIISKRRKDLNKSGAFAVPAPPSNVATNSIKRSASDLENFLSPKTQSNAAGGSLAAGQQLALPAVTTIKNSSLSIQQIGLPQSIDLVNTRQQKPSNVSVGVGTSCNATMPPNPNTASSGMMHTTTAKCSSTDPKDSTLIELLKRGTRVAVATKRTQHSTNNLITTTDISAAPHQIITNTGAVVIPSELQVLSTNASANHSTTRLHGSHPAAPVSISLAETTPLSLTISQTTGSSGDIYTLTYSTDSSGIFDEAEVYNVSDAEMLLQTVDSIQLLNDSSDERQCGHSDQFAPANTAINPVGGAGANSVASLADSLLDYQTYHSKELIMANSTNTSENAAHTQQLQGVRSNSLPQSSMPSDTILKQQVIAAGAMLSPLHSPLAYPTPPASHENATQSSPFVDEAQHFVGSANAFFNEKCSTDFLKDTADGDFFKNAPETTDRFPENDKMLKLKNVLEDSDFDTAIKVEDLLSGSDDTECDLREFAEQNLSFLDDDQEFLDDSGNATSPLSESFFTSGIGTAEEVKEVLREVLPDEHMKGEAQSENVIDLYYLPGIGLQSQMMPNSEDPLLSSSPRDFGQQRAQQHLLQVQQQQLQQQQQLYTTHLQQKPQMHPQTLQTDLKSAQMHPTPTSFIQGSNNEFPILITTTATKTSPQMEYNEPGLSQSQHFTNSPSSTQYKNSDTDMQTVIYTGSTDKEEITINPQQSHLEIGLESTAQSVDDTSVYFNNNSTSLLTSHQLTHIAPTRVPTSVPVPFSMSNGSESILLVTPVSQPGSILKRRLRSNDSGDPSKYHGLYRSKLRRPTRTHYTPAPTLNPDRKGLGLYCNIRQSFLPGSISFDAIDNDFDDPVGLVDFSDDSKVNLGSAYQAQLPPYEVPGNLDGLSSTASDELLWDPNVVPCVDSLKRFIELSKSGGPLGYHSEEEALQAVLQSQGNLQAAIVMLMNTQSTAFQMKWTANELERFLQSLERHGKNFATIAKELNTKSTGECVQMYYFWKKLNVDYKVTHLKVEKPVLPLVQPAELRPHVCEMPDCSASFTSKAALHGHTRIHCYGRSSNMPATSSISTASSGTSAAQSSGTSQLTGQPSSKDDFPCKVCGNEESQIDVIESCFKRNDCAEQKYHECP